MDFQSIALPTELPSLAATSASWFAEREVLRDEAGARQADYFHPETQPGLAFRGKTGQTNGGEASTFLFAPGGGLRPPRRLLGLGPGAAPGARRHADGRRRRRDPVRDRP